MTRHAPAESIARTCCSLRRATQKFPQNWIWWATLMPCMVWHGRMAQWMLMKFGFRLGLFRRVSTAVADFSE